MDLHLMGCEHEIQALLRSRGVELGVDELVVGQEEDALWGFLDPREWTLVSDTQLSGPLLLMPDSWGSRFGTEEADHAKPGDSQLAESHQLSVQPAPTQRDIPWGSDGSGQVDGERPMTGGEDVFAKLFLVGREDADAFATSRNGDVPLLGIRGGATAGVGDQDVVDRFTLGPIRRDRVSGQELAVTPVENTTVDSVPIQSASSSSSSTCRGMVPFSRRDPVTPVP